LPARIAIGRARAPAGTHTIDVAVSGRHRTQTLNLKPGGWAVLNLTVLR
jgi:hypothetical protein